LVFILEPAYIHAFIVVYSKKSENLCF